MLFQTRRTLGNVASAALLLFTSCSKKDASTGSSSSSVTALKVVFSDAAGNKVSGATVSLYATENDLLQESSPLKTGITDAQGQVTFSNLSSARYWYLGKKDCQNNMNSYTYTTAAIPANQTSVASTTMQSTGTLRFVNTSSNPYHVYVNGVFVGDQPGGTTANYKYEPTGSYTLRVVQISGYVFSPTDRTFTGVLTCNGTLTTTYP